MRQWKGNWSRSSAIGVTVALVAVGGAASARLVEAAPAPKATQKVVALSKYRKRVVERNAWKAQAFRWRNDQARVVRRLAATVRSTRATVNAHERRLARQGRIIVTLRAQLETLPKVVTDPHTAIRLVFGHHADAALRVVRCESNYRTWARNGQYRGLFQMGDYARGRYGHGETALEQTIAAHKYFMEDGWDPWECKP